MIIGQAHLSALKFNRIMVDKIEFIRAENCFTTPDNVDVIFKVHTFTKNENSNDLKVSLEVTIGDKSNDSIFISTVTTGYFEIDESPDITEKIKNDFAQKSTIAIMFPYIRSLITTITSQAGIEPIIFPTINIVKMVEEMANAEEVANIVE